MSSLRTDVQHDIAVIDYQPEIVGRYVTVVTLNVSGSTMTLIQGGIEGDAIVDENSHIGNADYPGNPLHRQLLDAVEEYEDSYMSDDD